MPEKGIFQRLVEAQPFTTVKQLRDERIALFNKIEELRKRPLISYVTSLNPLPRVTAYISHEDIVPFSEVVDSVEGDEVDVLIESPGGLSEVAVELTSILRKRFNQVGFIIPHAAMSAATILVMSADEILMDHRSSLGAIDPQYVGNDGRPQPAQAILTGIETIKKAVDENKGVLHPVYIPVLRNVDPGRLQSAIDASDLSKRIVMESLIKYKFKNWTQHKSTGKPVTPEERKAAATKIADVLCDHQKWLSHSHPIKIADLRDMGIWITDYGENKELQDAIWSLWVHYHQFISGTNTYKAYESKSVEFFKIALPFVENMPVQQQQLPALPGSTPVGGHVIAGVGCTKCSQVYKLQADFGQPQALEAGVEKFPKDSTLKCKRCGTIIDLSGLKLQIEARLGQNLIL